VINTERGSVTPDMPANRAFDHVILAIKLPQGIPDESVNAVIEHPTLGKLLFLIPPMNSLPLDKSVVRCRQITAF